MRVGTLVRVINPTGGIRTTDTFVVVPAPPDATPGMVWVRPYGPNPGRWTWWERTRDDPSTRPLGYYPSSLGAI